MPPDTPYTAIWQIVQHTVLWSLLATALVLVPSTLVAYALARYTFWGKSAVSALLSLPLVLPPTAAGYLLLTLLADQGLFGRDRLGIDLDILLTWRGVVVAYAVMALPLVVRTARVAFEAVNPRYETMARSLGFGPLRTFATVTLPLAGRGLLAAAILGFTRAMGEFGASVVLAGNIPGKTQTLAAAIYSAQQAGNESLAHGLVMIALGLGFAAVITTEWLSRRTAQLGGERA